MFDGENEILGTHCAEKAHAFIKKKHSKFRLLNFMNNNLANNPSSLSVHSLAKNLIFIHDENGGFYLFKINGGLCTLETKCSTTSLSRQISLTKKAILF